MRVPNAKSLDSTLIGHDKHRLFFLFAIGLFLCGIPFCRPLMSIGLILLSANWLAEGNFKWKWQQMRHNRILWVCLLPYAVHLIGLTYTSNLPYAFTDLTIKLPMLLLPLIIATTAPLTAKEWKLLLNIYLIAVCFSALFGLIHFKTHSELTDKRFLAVYISYIRFELNLCFALFVGIWLFRQQQRSRLRWLYATSILWIIFIILYVGAFTAIALSIFALFFLLVRFSIQHSKWYFHKLVPALLAAAVIGGLLVMRHYIRQYTHADFDFSTADSYTVNGNPYCDSLENLQIENNMYVYAYVCDIELQQAWNRRSDIRYYSDTAIHCNAIRGNLIRFLNSKSLRKDSVGVSMLSDEEIRLIEQGIPNVNYASNIGFKVRLYENLWEIINYLRFGEGLGSVPQRFEAWKISLLAIGEHPWFGIGTGDVKDTFLQKLETEQSPIQGILVRSHNQYLSFGIAFGIVGLAIILFSLVYPPFAAGKRNILYHLFLLIFLISMLTDDPLERQDGVCLFAVFNSLFLFLAEDGRQEAGDRRQETEDRRRKAEDGRQEAGDRRLKAGD